jgi:phenylpropionate dioxygenase-like ring-hydroxylating dioxygenase large terminal subunit
MKAKLSPPHYFADEVLLEERQSLFRRSWSFAGLHSRLSNDGDFACFRAGTSEGVVQNFGGRLRAFKNVCAHRHSRIQTIPEGNRPLRCPYHGWTYNDEGVPVVIPNKPCFREFGEGVDPKFRLESWQVECCGNLVFVRSGEGGPGLKEWLGGFYSLLEKMSAGMANRVDLNEFTVQANWKLWVENALEGYHTRWVHPESIYKMVPREDQYLYESQHSAMMAEVVVSDGHRKLVERLFAGRTYPSDGYEHFFVFPNILISTTLGVSFNVMVVEPVTARISRVTSHVFQTEGKLESRSAESKTRLIEEFGVSTAEYTRRVLDEDMAVVRGVQAGIEESHYEGVLGTMEERVSHFHDAWLSMNSR